MNEGGSIIKFYSADVADNVPKMFQIIAACWLIMGVVAISIIKIPKEFAKKDLNLKQTQIEIHQRYSISPNASVKKIKFQNRHSYANNLYFGWGGLIKNEPEKIEMENAPEEVMSARRDDDHKKEIEMIVSVGREGLSNNIPESPSLKKPISEFNEKNDGKKEKLEIPVKTILEEQKKEETLDIMATVDEVNLNKISYPEEVSSPIGFYLKNIRQITEILKYYLKIRMKMLSRNVLYKENIEYLSVKIYFF